MGIAISEGHIESIDDPISRYIPEVQGKGDRITIRDLMTMSSGLAYNTESEFFGDEARSYYEPDLRSYAIDFEVREASGNTFEYNNINPLLVGIILERATGSTVSEFLEEKIWKPLGMEFQASWSLDHSGFEKMESGINARAVDFLRFGRLYLNEGVWNGRVIVPRDYVHRSTTPSDNPALNNLRGEEFGYNSYWWLNPRPEGRNDFWADGNLGQFIYISPVNNMVIVRNGKQYGYGDWPGFFRKLSDELSRL